MKPFQVVLIEHGYANSHSEERIVTEAGARFLDADRLPLNEAVRKAEEADAILLRRSRVDREMIGRFRRCQFLLRYGVGTDNIDVQAATEAGIMVGYVPGYCIDEVSTQTVGLLLACCRDISLTDQALHRGEWDVPQQGPFHRLEGKTLGLVGLGNIGRAVARKLNGWGLTLLANDPFINPARTDELGVRRVDLETLCRRADLISLHVPLLSETRHLIGPQQFELMRPGCILVNTARGPVLDTTALLTALDNGLVARAGLDVFEEEPLPADSPLRHHPRVTLSNHIAWYSEESQAQLQTIAGEETARVCRGQLPRYLANPEVLKRLGRLEEWEPEETVQWQWKRLRALGMV